MDTLALTLFIRFLRGDQQMLGIPYTNQEYVAKREHLYYYFYIRDYLYKGFKITRKDEGRIYL